MDKVRGGPSILLDSLIYYLDASNVYSYVSGSTSWNNISNYVKSGGTLVNGINFSNDNKGCLVLDGVDDYIQLPQITNNQTFGKYSFSIWFSPTITITSANTTNYMLMEAQNTQLGGVDNYLYFLGSIAGRAGFQTFNPFSVTYTTTNLWEANKWYNITGTYDITTSRLSLYVNGKRESFTTIANCYFNTNTYYGLGAYTNPPRTWFYPVRIASYYVYVKTLTDDEVLQNYLTFKRKFEL
jgi:hypothetical protein